MCRRHLPFCRLDNRTIYLGIHFLLPFVYCPGPYPTLLLLPHGLRPVGRPPLPDSHAAEAQSPAAAKTISTGLTTWARSRARLVSPPSPSPFLPGPQHRHRDRHRHRHTDRKQDRETHAYPHPYTTGHPPIPWEARPVKTPRRTQPRHRA